MIYVLLLLSFGLMAYTGWLWDRVLKAEARAKALTAERDAYIAAWNSAPYAVEVTPLVEEWRE